MSKFLVSLFWIFVISCTVATASIVEATSFYRIYTYGANSSGNGLTVSNGSISAPSTYLYAVVGTSQINGLNLNGGSLFTSTLTASGLITANRIISQTLLGSSNGGTTTSYVLPLYDVSGGSYSSTAHIVEGDYSPGTTGTFTVTLTGAAIFANAHYFAYCKNDNSGGNGIIATSQTTTSFDCSVSGRSLSTDSIHYFAISI